MTTTVAVTPDQNTWTLDGEGLRLGDAFLRPIGGAQFRRLICTF